RTPENVERVRTAMNKSPRKSLRRASQQLDLSYGTVHNIVKSLKLHPYKIQIEQPLKAGDMERRLNFAQEFTEFLNSHPAVLKSIWFSDEAHFWLDGYVNKQKMRFGQPSNLTKL